MFYREAESWLGAFQMELVGTHLPMQETQETRVQSLDQADPREEATATHSSILPGVLPASLMDREAWQATVHRVARESDMTEAT